MEKFIDFKQVAKVVRYTMLADLNLPTPQVFYEMTNEEKNTLYDDIFTNHHDICTFLTSHLDIDKLMSRYSEENQNGAGE